MKIIFLDFDGVLNSLQSVYYWKNRGEDFPDNWCPVACNNLNLLLNNFPDLGIVISSTWRGHGMERCKQVLKKHNIDTSQIIGMTPKLWKERGYEIEEWLNTNQDKKIEDFIIFVLVGILISVVVFIIRSGQILTLIVHGKELLNIIQREI